MLVDRREITITGKYLKTARIEEEWFEDIEDPELLIERIRKSKIKADIFTFWQRLPEVEPKYEYYREWDNVAALSITSFDNWWKNQIDAKTRNVIRKAEKKGVVVRTSDFSDEFVTGITNIFNETPVRQGKLFWHYGKGFETIKREISDRLDKSEFIGAYYNDELIGFIKLLYAGKYAMAVEILSKIEHRDKAPTNALVAKAVEICDEKKIPYLVYAKWPRGTLADFKRNNAFKKIDLPRYYIPLTVKGSVALTSHLHHGLTGLMPEKLTLRLIDFRKKWYSK